ncbi:MAG: NAD(P)/FAD-dependent oxidoreductase [Acidimicrobiales bacterium]
MTKLADKRVGIIGTGATAVQCIPHLAQAAHELYVFQRTPSSIDVRNNHPIDPEWFASLASGWQARWLTNFATLQSGGLAHEDLVQDGWTDIAQRIRRRVLVDGGDLSPTSIRRAYEVGDDEKMSEIRARVDEIVKDRETAEALKPWYRQLCKRPCFHDEYLQAYNLPTVHLVDTNGQGVDRIDESGLWVAGRHYEVDCLIFASGFEVGTEYTRRASLEVVGRSGHTLSEDWSEGMRTMHGIHVFGFPNIFIVGVTQAANLISNVTHNLTEAATTIAAVIARTLSSGYHEVEVSAAGEAAWMNLLEGTSASFLADPECTPGYYNNEGRPMGLRERRNLSRYPEGPVAYFEYIDAWRNSGSFENLDFCKRSS